MTLASLRNTFELLSSVEPASGANRDHFETVLPGCAESAKVTDMADFSPTDAAAASGGSVSDYLDLTKPRIVLMVLVTAAIGFHLGNRTELDVFLLLRMLLGTALAAGGTLALNQYLERDLDAQMERTRNRPIPSGRVDPTRAALFGAVVTVVGLLILTLYVHPLAGVVTATTTISYLFIYTPMKKKSSLSTLVGAVPGALPPMTGWAAASGGLEPGAWALFAIMFLWQLPHSLAIAKLYTDDYARAGFQLLPVVDQGGSSTERHIVNNCAALLVVGLLPTWFGVAGQIYFVTALVLGLGLLAAGIALARDNSRTSARRLLLMTLVYLPLLLVVMAIDKRPV